MKRSLIFVAALGVLCTGALFGVSADARPSAAPTPSAAPSALPTATPEPPDKAIPRLLSTLQSNPNDKQALRDLAAQYLSIGRPDMALPLTQKLLALGQKTAEVYYFDGYANEQLGRVAPAIADYEAAGNMDPTNVGVLGALTQVYMKVNRLADAERIAKRAVTFNPKEKRAYVNYGLALATEQKYDEARAQFEQAFALDNTDVTPLLQIGQTYANQNSWANALNAANRALTADPKNVQAMLFRADVYAKQHDVVNALASYQAAVALAGDDDMRAGIMDREGMFLASEKKNADAEAMFQQAISKYPTVYNAHLAYGDYLSQNNQIGKAVSEWTLALGPDKSNTEALKRLVAYNMSRRNFSQAVSYLNTLARAEPSPQNLMQLGQAYTLVHDYRNAKSACQAAYQMQPNPDSLGCMAGADYEIHNYAEAAKIFDVLDSRVHQYLDRNGQLLYVAGQSYENTKQPAKALVEYKRLLALMRPNSSGYTQVKAKVAKLSHAPASKPKSKH